VRRLLALVVVLAVLFAVSCSRKEEAFPVADERLSAGQQAAGADLQKPGREIMAVKEPVVAGTFYPSQPAKLESVVNGFISEADKVDLPGRVLGLIAPHAGYVYSGPVAGWSFRQVEGESYDIVVVLGPSHFIPLNGASVLLAEKYRTPLGDVPLDVELAEKLIDSEEWIGFDPMVYRQEHSLEVELPFIQRSLKPGYKLLMISVGTHRLPRLERLAEILTELLSGKNALLVASTDLSHYHPYDVANQIDARTIELIKAGEARALLEHARRREVELCGLGPVIVLTEFFKLAGGKADDIVVLKYLNSGDTAGDKMRVVGYGAVAFCVKDGAVKKTKGSTEEQVWDLSHEERQRLLEIARTTLVEYITNGNKPEFEVSSAKLKENGAAFVTLKIGGRLRGCVGHVVAREPLYQCVRDMAIAASTQDARFPPVTADELKRISIEITVLTPMQRVKDISEIKVGRDGLMMRRGFNSGLLLPQVPVEYGWDRETFLRQTCLKAGLPKDAWKDEATEIYRFQGLVFGED